MPIGAAALFEALKDRYALERQLGRGGMATVYLARDLRYDRLVALDRLRSGLATESGTGTAVFFVESTVNFAESEGTFSESAMGLVETAVVFAESIVTAGATT